MKKLKSKLFVASISMVSSLAFANDTVPSCMGDKDIVLTEGKILTMNPDKTVAKAIRIRNRRIIAIDNVGDDECTTTINLQGRTVVPGLIDSHLHFTRQGLAPGYDTREAESATSVEQLLNALKRKSNKIPKDQFVTVLGGFSTTQFEENRIPSLTELDEFLPDRPVYIQLGFAGPAHTNSIGKERFKQLGILVNSSGTFSQGKETGRAFAALQSQQTLSDKIRGTRDLMNYANSVGLSMVFDEGGTGFPGASFFNARDDYQALMVLSRSGQATLRIRIQHTSTAKSAARNIYDERIENTFPLFGSSMIKYAGTGEHIVSFPAKGLVNPVYANKVQKTANLGWSHEQHSVSDAENRQHLSMIKAAHKETPINKLRWSLSHVFELGSPGTEDLLADLKSMNMGLRVQNHAFTTPTDHFPLGRTLKGQNAGPLYRILYDAEIPMGAGTDGSLLGPMNPWFSIYYMVTGKDNTGKLVNPGQTLSRLEALQLYTTGNAWFGFDENDLGSLEVGKLADLVVLNKDYLSVPEDDIRTIKSVLTMVDGMIVYEDAEHSLTK